MTSRVKIDFEYEYPAGYKTFKRRFDVAGLSSREEAVRSYVTWRNHSVSMQAEPDSDHDKNAIAVYGHGQAGWLLQRKRKVRLGYLPKEIAKQLAEQCPVEKAAIHLNQIDVGEYLWMSLCTSHVKISISVPEG